MLKHFSFILRNENGDPICGQSVYIYKYGTTNELDIFYSSGNQITQPLVTSSVDPSGSFNFYVKDEWSGGYTADQKMTIDWGLGNVTGIDIFDKLYRVDETSTSTDKNKLISNKQAYDWELHRGINVETTPTSAHNLEHVDINDYSNTDYNKVVSNFLLNDMYYRTGSTITITASGSTVSYIGINPEGGASPAWASSPVTSAGDYYADVTHSLGNKYPVASVWRVSDRKMVKPIIEGIDDNTIRIYVNEDVLMILSVVG